MNHSQTWYFLSLEDMTHKELAILARKIAARDNNDALHNLAIALQDAVDAEKDSAQIAEKVIEMLSAAQ